MKKAGDDLLKKNLTALLNNLQQKILECYEIEKKTFQTLSSIIKWGDNMKKYLKIGLLGFSVWLIPFAVSFLIFTLKTSLPALFESIMPVVITICVVFFNSLFEKHRGRFS